MLPRRSPRPDTPGGTPSARQLLALLAPLALPLAAMAHPGADGGGHPTFTDGLLHPFTGLDHCAAMLAVGMWSALDGRRVWMAPLAFASALAVGALLAAAGIAFAAVEPVIAASLLVFGLALAVRQRLHPRVAALVVGAFALFHGAAHGGTLGAGAALLGVLAGTVALHAAGIALGLLMRRRSRWWPRAAGGVVAALGAGLLLAGA